MQQEVTDTEGDFKVGGRNDSRHRSERDLPSSSNILQIQVQPWLIRGLAPWLLKYVTEKEV
jgi:hypothetical protein